MGAPIGNQNAAKAKRWTAAIERALDRRAQDKGLRSAQEALDQLAEQFLQAVEEGDTAAWRELGDRLEGKPAQVLAGDPDNPLQLASSIRVILGRDPGPVPSEA